MQISRREMLKGMGITAAAIAVGACDAIIGESDVLAASSPESGKADLTDHIRIPAQDGCYVDDPVLASDGSGRSWAAWLNRLPDDKESILFSEYSDGWSDALPAIPAQGRYESPRLACAPNGSPMLVWIQIQDDAWVLQSSMYKNGVFDRPEPVSSRKGKAQNPFLLAMNDGTFWTAWESYRRGKFRICMKHFSKGSWGKEIVITDSRSNAYDPAIAVDRNGKVWAAYSSVDRGHRNILLTSYDPEKKILNPSVIVAAGGNMVKRPNVKSYPSVWCDADDRVWVAYEHDSQPSKGTLSYHGWRECSVVCVQDGILMQVDSPGNAQNGCVVIGSDNDHYPTFMTDGFGRLWTFSRKSEQAKRGWNLRASCLDGASGWTPAVSLLPPNELGRLSKPALALIGGTSYWTAWQEDNFIQTGDWINNVRSSIHIARINLPASQNTDPSPALKKADLPSPSANAKGRPWVERRKIKCNGEEYILLYGNLHEHSLLSRCWVDGSDGTLDDNYRHGVNVEGYDFMAMTDHDFDSYEAAWRKTRRAAQFYNSEPEFIALPAYEWTLVGSHKPPSAGHRNIIFVSDKDAANFVFNGKSVYGVQIPEGNRMDKVWRVLREKGIKDAVTIPHHPADFDHPMDWNFHDPEYQCVVEIFQCRESAEYEGCPHQTTNLTKHKGCFVQDALARGYKMGFVASGDHNSMGIGLAALLVKDVSREGILEALRARRCYATTGDKIFVDFRVGGRMMGEEYSSAEKPRITAAIDCPEPIDNIVVFKNNKVIYEKKKSDLGSVKTFKVDFVDDSFSSDSYYYLRAIQANNQIVWASPVWVNFA